MSIQRLSVPEENSPVRSAPPLSPRRERRDLSVGPQPGGRWVRRRHPMYSLPILAGLMLSVSVVAGTSALAASPAIPLYHATYSVSRNDLRIGTTVFTLGKSKSGIYAYQSVTQPAGLVSLFRSDVITETSHFNIVDGTPHSLLYSYTHSGGGDNKPQSIRFDWNRKLAYSSDGDRHKTLPLESGFCDRLLAQLLISLDAAHSSLDNSYRVLDHGELQIYRLHEVRQAKLDTPAGTFDTVEVARQDKKKNRTTTFWLAPKLDYLPVQMRQTEPGKATITLLLTQIQLDSKNPT